MHIAEFVKSDVLRAINLSPQLRLSVKEWISVVLTDTVKLGHMGSLCNSQQPLYKICTVYMITSFEVITCSVSNVKLVFFNMLMMFLYKNDSTSNSGIK